MNYAIQLLGCSGFTHFIHLAKFLVWSLGKVTWCLLAIRHMIWGIIMPAAQNVLKAILYSSKWLLPSQHFHNIVL